MLDESSMNSGAFATSLIQHTSLIQSSSLIWPVLMEWSATRASAASSRMVISFRLISRLKITDVSPCLMDAARARSRASVGLWVGIMLHPARYKWSAESTWTHLTGTDETGRAAVM